MQRSSEPPAYTVAFERPLPSQQLACEPLRNPEPISMSCEPPVSGPLDGLTLPVAAWGSGGLQACYPKRAYHI